ncbi:MAG: aminotransferase class III-fold pyridoxal phosphate-dependent enzyme [Kofleriaceae bacterium]
MTHSLTTAEADAIVAKDEQYIMRPWTHPKGEPVIVARAKGCVVTDVHGYTDYLDFTAGYFVNNAGHCHPRIVEAATAQLSQVLQVSGKHGTIPAIRSLSGCELVAADDQPGLLSPPAAPRPTSCVEDGASGLGQERHRLPRQRLPRAHPRRPRGHRQRQVPRERGQAAGGHSFTIPNAYCYRCKFGPAASCKVECLDGVEAQLAARPTGAILAEPIQSVGGLAPPRKWWDRLDGIRKKLGLLLIIDEVQTGLGRSGKMFGLEHYGLEPEIVSGGKGLSGGVGSLAMTCAGTDVIKKFFGGTTPTNGGNAVSAAAGIALIDTLIDEGMIANAAAMGQHFTEAAWALRDPWIGDVRFTGLLGGIELVSSTSTKEVLPKAALAAIKDDLHDAGMLITMSGTHGNCLRLQPPLVVTAAQIDTFLATLKQVLASVRAR